MGSEPRSFFFFFFGGVGLPQNQIPGLVTIVQYSESFAVQGQPGAVRVSPSLDEGVLLIRHRRQGFESGTAGTGAA